MKIFDLRTNAELKIGMRYPLLVGGYIEIVRVALPTRFSASARALLRVERGTNVRFSWVPMNCNQAQTACGINFPPLNLNLIRAMRYRKPVESTRVWQAGSQDNFHTALAVGRPVIDALTGKITIYPYDKALFGRAVSSYPDWMTLSTNIGQMAILTTISDNGGTADTCDQIKGIDAWNAVEGTPTGSIESETPLRKRQWVSAKCVIFACRLRNDPVQYGKEVSMTLAPIAKDLGVYSLNPFSKENLIDSTKRFLARVGLPAGPMVFAPHPEEQTYDFSGQKPRQG